MITWTRPSRTASGPAEPRYSETTTKSTFFRGQYLIGFSGVADLGGDTEKWLIARLAEKTSLPGVKHWRDDLARDVVAELKRLAFADESAAWFSLLVIGFARDRSTGELTPVLQTISNDKEPSTIHPGRIAKDAYQMKLATPVIWQTRGDFKFWAVGNTPDLSSVNATVDTLRRYRRRYPNNSLEVARTMARLIVQRSSELDGRGVGRSVQVAVMPRSALGHQWISAGAFEEPLEGVTCIEFNPTRETRSGSPVHVGCNVVAEGMAVHHPSVSHGATEFIRLPAPFAEPPSSNS